MANIAGDLTAKYWGTRIWNETRDNLFLSRIMGKSQADPIVVDTDLQRHGGSDVYIPIMAKMNGEPAVGDVQVVGNEQEMVVGSDHATVMLYTWGVRAPGKEQRFKNRFDALSAAKDGIKNNAAEWIEDAMCRILAGDTTITFGSVGTAPTAGHYWDSTATSCTVDTLLKAKYKALKVGKIKPVRRESDGAELLYGIISPGLAYDLQNDTKYQSIQYYAEDRGSKNSVFRGTLKPIHGILLHVSDFAYEPLATTGRLVLLGQEAAVWALGAGPDLTTDITTHYADRGTKPGYYIDRICGFKKVVNSNTAEDHGTYVVDYTQTNLAA